MAKKDSQGDQRSGLNGTKSSTDLNVSTAMDPGPLVSGMYIAAQQKQEDGMDAYPEPPGDWKEYSNASKLFHEIFDWGTFRRED